MKLRRGLETDRWCRMHSYRLQTSDGLNRQPRRSHLCYTITMRVPPYVSSRTEPWKDHPKAERVALRLVPLHILHASADQNQLKQIHTREQQYIAELMQSLQADGLHEPLQMGIDKRGKLLLKNGHHRLVAATLLDWCRLPVELSGLKHATEETFLMLLPVHDFEWWWSKKTWPTTFSTRSVNAETRPEGIS